MQLFTANRSVKFTLNYYNNVDCIIHNSGETKKTKPLSSRYSIYSFFFSTIVNYNYIVYIFGHN